MDQVVKTIFAGLLGTGGMSFAMWLITRSGVANADMIRAIGSIFTHSYENSFKPGLIIHLVTGTLIAFIYILLINLLSPTSIAYFILTGAMIGLFHGVAFSFLLVVSVAEHHPLERFREAGSEVAVAHLVGHIIYGLIVGTVVGLLNIKFF
ncbi:MAG TPA: DUF6789 family protein [Thermodesulfobacteriota bacterium]|jgi:uncharacterized membrane protein YagU involved in acid resistance|nr:DUF6789 family protein [Thermodesulfobacteriota bacterium]